MCVFVYSKRLLQSYELLMRTKKKYSSYFNYQVIFCFFTTLVVYRIMSKI